MSGTKNRNVHDEIVLTFRQLDVERESRSVEDKLIEEMAELTQAILKYRYIKRKRRWSDLKLELADVCIQITRFIDYHDMFDEIENLAGEKIEKIKKRNNL